MMTSPAPSAPAPQARRHGTRATPSRLPHIILLSVLAVLLSAGTFAGAVYQDFSSRLQAQSSDINDLLGTSRPQQEEEREPSDSFEGQDLNILLLGSDSRDDENSDFGEADGMRSDTAMIIHIAEDRSRVDVISIPRDLIVEIPQCRLPDGSYSYMQPLGDNEFNGVRFNTAFSIGSDNTDIPHGAACAILTVENMTDLYIDDWAVVDMDGFRTMVDAIGGVEMCIEDDIDNRWAKLELEAGCQTLDGEEALGFARVRKGIGDGSDIGRIERQQELMGAMADQTLSAGVLANPTKLFPLLEAVASSLHTSERLGKLSNLAGLGYSLNHLEEEDINFITPPLEYAGNVVLQTWEMQEIWDNLREDQPLDDVEEEPEGGEADDAEQNPTEQ